jgi:hypothetical protein
MRPENLLKPGNFSVAEKLRRLVAVAIGNIQSAKAKGAVGEGAQLSAFLHDAASKTPDAVSGLPATQAVLSNGQTVNVRTSTGGDSHGSTAVVAAGAITGVNLAATTVMVDNADTMAIQNSAGAAIGTGTATVAAGALSNVKLPATVAGVTNGTKYNAGTVSGSGNFATFTVANGVITGIVLSAS